MTSGPLVSIGLPTYNRAEKLVQAMEFILSQDYRNIEVVISDNASTDDTAAVCERLCRKDSRIHYIRQATNIGPIANYIAVLEAASGEMYMALADDDWLAPNYVSSCLAALLDDSALVLACGQSAMYRDGEFSHEAVATNLLDDDPQDRVVRYYRIVAENAAYHGLARREVLLRLPRLAPVLASDWLWIASIAYQGKIATIPSATIVKHLGGATVSWEAVIATLGLPPWQARYWSEAILLSVTRNILTSPVYRSLGRSGRILLAARVAATLGYKWRIWRRWRQYARQVGRNTSV